MSDKGAQESISAQYLAGCYAGDDPRSSGTAGGCKRTWDRERRQWRASMRPCEGAAEIVAYADNGHAAQLAVFAKWLGCEEDLVKALS